MAKKLKLPKSLVPKHNKLMRRMEIGDAAVKGRFQDAWEEIQRRSQDSRPEATARRGDE